MDFRLLGPFEVHDGDGPIPIGASRQRGSFGVAGHLSRSSTVVGPNHRRDLGRFTAPFCPQDVARVRLALRRALQASVDNDPIGELLLSRNPGYVLAINDSQIDAVRFERMVADASSALGSGQPEDVAADGIREAMSLWRGTALADFAYEPFAATESQRLMERRIEAVELRIDADLALARSTSLVAELEGLVAEYPMRGRLWAQLDYRSLPMRATSRCSGGSWMSPPCADRGTGNRALDLNFDF